MGVLLFFSAFVIFNLVDGLLGVINAVSMVAVALLFLMYAATGTSISLPSIGWIVLLAAALIALSWLFE